MALISHRNNSNIHVDEDDEDKSNMSTFIDECWGLPQFRSNVPILNSNWITIWLDLIQLKRIG